MCTCATGTCSLHHIDIADEVKRVGGEGTSSLSNEKETEKTLVRKVLTREMKKLNQIYSTINNIASSRRAADNTPLLELRRGMVSSHNLIVGQQTKIAQLRKDKEQLSTINLRGEKGEQTATLREQQILIEGLKGKHQLQHKRILEYKTECMKQRSALQRMDAAVQQNSITIQELRDEIERYQAQLEAAELRLRNGKVIRTETPQRKESSPRAAAEPVNPDRIAQMIDNGTPVPAQKLNQLEETLVELDERALDDKTREDRRKALEMLESDRHMRQEKVSITFQKLREMFKKKELQERMASLQPNDKLSKTLQRMEQRHNIAIAEWERRKEQMLKARRQQLMQIMQVFSNIVVYRPSVTVVPKVAGVGVKASSSKDFLKSHVGGRQPGFPLTTTTTHQVQQPQMATFSKHKLPPAKIAPLLGDSGKPDMVQIFGLKGTSINFIKHMEAAEKRKAQRKQPQQRPVKLEELQQYNFPETSQQRLSVGHIQMETTIPVTPMQKEEQPQSRPSSSPAAPLPPVQTPTKKEQRQKPKEREEIILPPIKG
jgi:hypothetical protein